MKPFVLAPAFFLFVLLGSVSSASSQQFALPVEGMPSRSEWQAYFKDQDQIQALINCGGLGGGTAAPIGPLVAPSAPPSSPAEALRRLHELTSSTQPGVNDARNSVPPSLLGNGGGGTYLQRVRATPISMQWEGVVSEIFDTCNASTLKTRGDGGLAVMCIGVQANQVCPESRECRHMVRVRVAQEFGI